VEEGKEYLSVLKNYKVNDLDTAKLYTGSEKNYMKLELRMTFSFTLKLIHGLQK